MLNFFAKLLLVSTSLSPALVAVATSEFENGSPWCVWGLWLLIASSLVIVCWRILEYAREKAQKYPLYIKEFDRRDQEMLTFLFIYLLPFIRIPNHGFMDDWITLVYVLSIIIVALVYADALHFNPVMRLIFGYRFYAVKDQQGVSNLLISKKKLLRPEVQLETVVIGTDIFLYTGDRDV